MIELMATPESDSESDVDGLQSSLAHNTNFAPIVPHAFQKLTNHPHLCTGKRKIALEEVRNIYEFQIGKSFLKP